LCTDVERRILLVHLLSGAHTLARVPARIKQNSFSFPGRGYRFELRRQASKRSQKWTELRKKGVFSVRLTLSENWI
jgi:hypothetical protein